jgi:HAD superfamily hydrolase (TIGR01450 family)
VALDLDGTIYRGGTLFPSTIPFLKLVKELGVGFTFLTNNSSKSTGDYLKHLERLGINASPGQLYTSTQATVRFLRESLPDAKRLFILGTPSLIEEMRAEGFGSTADDATDEPDAVLAGFDTTLVFSRLCRAAYWISKGKPFIATHPDRVCPTDQPTVLVDCGSVCAALEKATGRAPDAVLGKPHPSMLSCILQRHALSAEELALVGDRLYTDMAMARSVGALAILVLTGETTPADLQRAESPPDLVVPGLAELGEELRRAKTN